MAQSGLEVSKHSSLRVRYRKICEGLGHSEVSPHLQCIKVSKLYAGCSWSVSHSLNTPGPDKADVLLNSMLKTNLDTGQSGASSR